MRVFNFTLRFGSKRANHIGFKFNQISKYVSLMKPNQISTFQSLIAAFALWGCPMRLIVWLKLEGRRWFLLRVSICYKILHFLPLANVECRWRWICAWNRFTMETICLEKRKPVFGADGKTYGYILCMLECEMCKTCLFEESIRWRMWANKKAEIFWLDWEESIFH